ncbi:DUF1905 domain-containing protein [Novosphingobium sp.]|uniref:DUF1905 domain-containing protein n=1 Tax=Novosphingobium sp. TaxID=1874826 RepID=UPI0026175D67|nr:DUF1905 domain-containing protein [Novosphingobium sp.]
MADKGVDLLFDAVFEGTVIEWRGPAPYLFVPVPEAHLAALRHAARIASYGWGVVPVTAEIAGIRFATSLFPRDGGYLLPVKLAVQRAAAVMIGSPVNVRISVQG